MKMTAEHRAIDKIYRRRDRYEIPDWQRGEVWDTAKKQRLIDSILRGWKLPKFYFVSVSDDHFLVEDGQQRLAAIYEFFTDDLALTSESAALFGGEVYSSLKRKVADSFDDFEIEYDIIQDATDEELKEFFLRLQEGMSLTSSEKLNAVHSKLRDFCRKTAEHAFFTEVIAVANTRYAHFDIMAKVAAIEVEGIATGLRLDDVKQVFVSHNNFASTSAVAKRIRGALDFLHTAFKDKGALLRTRTIVQSVVTLACKIIATGRSSGVETQFRKFLETFTAELETQVEMGPRATDTDYIMFQGSVNANIKGGAQARQQILLRKLFRIAPDLADIFDPTIITESGVSVRIGALSSSITQLVSQINQKFSAKNGDDLFKATNKTAQALVAIGKAIKTVDEYEAFIDNLYFLVRESVGTRLGANWPTAFVHVNDLRTDLRHDVDHGDAAKVRAKKRKAGTTFTLYAGGGTPDTVDPIKFPLIQLNLLGALEADLRGLLVMLP